MLTLTVGDGKTYSSIANALAAIPDPMTDDVTIERYADAGSVTDITVSQIDIPSNSMSNSLYTLKIKGMTGSIQQGGQIKLTTATGSAGVFNNTAYVHYGLTFENLYIEGLGTTRAFFNNQALKPTFIDCYLSTEDIYAVYSYSNKSIVMIRCVIDVDNSYGMYAQGNYIFIDQCLFVTGNASGYWNYLTGIHTITNSVVVAKSGSPLRSVGFLNAVNCAFISMNGSQIVETPISEADSSDKIITFSRCLFYSSGTWDGTNSISDWIDRHDVVMPECITADPLLTASGDARTYATPQAGSPLLASVIGGLANPLYDTTNNPQSIGVYDDYTAISDDDIIDTSGGNFTVSTLSNGVIQEGVVWGLNSTETGTYNPLSNIPNPPIINTVDQDSQSITISVTADDEADEVYAIYRMVPSGEWSDENATFSRTGSGDITISGIANLTDYETYEVIAYSRISGGAPSENSKPIYVTPRPFGPTVEMGAMVDSVAESTLSAIKLSGFGKVLEFTNWGEDTVEIWGAVTQTRMDSIDIKSGNVDYSEIAFTVPKQLPHFPPKKVHPGAIIKDTEGGRTYQIVRVEYSGANMIDSAVYDLYCDVLGGQTCL